MLLVYVSLEVVEKDGVRFELLAWELLDWGFRHVVEERVVGHPAVALIGGFAHPKFVDQGEDLFVFQKSLKIV